MNPSSLSPASGLDPRYYTFWSINGALDQQRLRQQLADFVEAGLHGVVFHPRFYPGIPAYMSPEYLSEVSACILHAKKLGLRFWIYDENGWPSGTGDGQVMAKYPDSGAMRLDIMTESTADSIGVFHTDDANRIVPADTPGAKTWHLTPRKTGYVDSLDPKVCGHFLQLIHERYRTGLAPEAWDYVEAFFADEPEAGIIKDPFPDHAGVPWSRVLPEKLVAAYGADYATKLPLLFARGEGCEEVRIKYWELITDALIDGFFVPYHDWCKQSGKQFIGHVKGEEHPLFQLPIVGSCQRIYRHLSIPGIDSLERYPALDFYPRQAAAVSRQFSNGRSMVECIGGAGWGLSPEDLERYVLWLGRNGLTDFVFHLSQYRLDTPALTDWPPSQPLHMSWRETYPAVLARITKKLTSEPPSVPDTLVVAPYRGLMAEYEPWELWQTNLHNASTFPDTPASRMNQAFLKRLDQLKADGIAYDVIDERTLEEDARFEGGAVIVGRITYPHLIIDPAARLSAKCAEWTTPLPSKKTENASEKPAPTEPDTISLTWDIPALPENAWLIEPTPGATERTFIATFQLTADHGTFDGLCLHFADDLVSAQLDGHTLGLEKGYDGTLATLLPQAPGEHRLEFTTVRAFPAKPFVWLKGPFTLKSHSAYAAGPTQTICTAGPFIATHDKISANGELVGAGVPFLQHSLGAHATLHLERATSRLRFTGLLGDALHLSADGRALGWAWGPDWEIVLKKPLPTGTHKLRAELVPSTFNHFGPHHYYNGDWHVVSPDQIVGRKNFADAPDAPDHTHVAAWHFKPLQLPASVIASG